MGLFIKSDLDKKLDEANKEITQLKELLVKYSRHNARGAGRKGRMTEEDKKLIAELRSEGLSYNKIAKRLNLPVGSVFNYAKTIVNSNDSISGKIKKITESLGIDTIPSGESIDFNNFIEINKYRDLMNIINSKTKT